MKQCPYCGKEYPDNEVNCLIDGYLLKGDVADATENALGTSGISSEAAPIPDTEAAAYRRYPDYKWSARDVWKCMGMILVLEFVLGSVHHVLNLQPIIHRWSESGFGYFFVRLMFFSVYVLSAAYFARTETLATFWNAFGFNRKPSEYVWFGAAMALLIRTMGHLLLVNHLGKGRSNYDLSAFRHSTGLDKYLFILPLLMLAPIFEEATNRGFLYRAFRGSYRVWVSMFLMVAWTAITHWGQYVHWVAAMDLSLLTLVQCHLREKSDSIWDCIICHFIFNGTSLLIAPFH